MTCSSRLDVGFQNAWELRLQLNYLHNTAVSYVRYWYFCFVGGFQLLWFLQVCLQNCHLAESDLLALTTLVNNLSHREDLHPEFRLWLTLAATPIVPAGIMASGNTVVLEAPRGIRSGLLHALHAVPEDILQPLVLEEFSANNQMQQLLWAQTVLAVSMYHAAICEVGTNLLPSTAADKKLAHKVLARVKGLSTLNFDQVTKNC